jgi:Tol biopolymer transport system component
MAAAYERLDNVESRKLYEQVLREYPDQKEAAATARQRLGLVGAVSVPGGSNRQVWTPAGNVSYSSISPDGRYFAFYAGGDLTLHDFSTGMDLSVTPPGNKGTARAVISPDSRQVAYVWYSEPPELRIAPLNGNGASTHRVLFKRPETAAYPTDSSSDGKSIAVKLFEKGGNTAQIGVLSVANGRLRVLKSVGWRGSTRVLFSPDGQYLAYHLPAAPDSDIRDIFVLSVDGSRETPAVVHAANDVLAGWSPDGKHLLFTSDRRGSFGLWSLPFANGKPQGEPELVRPNFGGGPSWNSLAGMTRSGAVYYTLLGGAPQVGMAAFGFESGKALEVPSAQLFNMSLQPEWSHDGRYLAYRHVLDTRDSSIVIRSVENGQSRELVPKLEYFNWPRWSPDGRSFLVEGSDLKLRRGIFRIDAQTAEVETIAVAAPDEYFIQPQWSAEGKVVYGRFVNDLLRDNAELIVRERELNSAQEREIVRVNTAGQLVSGPSRRAFVVSPDGQSLVYRTWDSAHPAAMLVPIAGGQPRELLKAAPEDGVNIYSWTPDSRAVVFSKSKELWIYPTDGGQPRKIDLNEPTASQVQIRPQGNHVAYWIQNRSPEEVWVLENFLPSIKTAK